MLNATLRWTVLSHPIYPLYKIYFGNVTTITIQFSSVISPVIYVHLSKKLILKVLADFWVCYSGICVNRVQSTESVTKSFETCQSESSFFLCFLLCLTNYCMKTCQSEIIFVSQDWRKWPDLSKSKHLTPGSEITCFHIDGNKGALSYP